MITVRVGNLLESRAQTLVNTVNCVGVMGKGIALDFKTRFPAMFQDYERRCEKGDVRLGRPYIFKPLIPPFIVNFPTKDHWRSVARLNDIVHGLEYLLEHYNAWGVTSIAVPPLGCGNGQLEWRIVGPTLYRYLKRMNIPVELYAPYGTPHAELNPTFLNESAASRIVSERSFKPEWVGVGGVALVEILSRIQRQQYHWPVGRTIFQKIAYVAAKEHIPTRLTFQRGSFGPFAPDLKKLQTRLVNHGLMREERRGRMFVLEMGSTFSDARKAYADELEKYEGAISRIADLFLRMDTDRAEVTATVLFSAEILRRKRGVKSTERELLTEVMEWKQKRRPPLDEKDVALNIRNLAALGWLDLESSPDLPLTENDLIMA